jgi:uncharacterized damage-inducible protein DinB
MNEAFSKLYEYYLEKLKTEIEQYGDDGLLWSVSQGINNSAGNLCLHLLGNLNNYIGAKLGKSGYERDRPAEFSTHGVSRSDLLRRIDETKKVVRDSILRLSEQDLLAEYPNDEDDEKRTVAAELVHILSHFNYHLGQINYHRRLLSGR